MEMNVVLFDAERILQFVEHDVVIPITVIEEVDP